MTRKILTVCLLLVAGTTGADTADEVRCAEIGFALALEAGNRDAFAAYLDPDARFVGGSVSRGPEEILEAWTPYFEAGGPKLVWRPQIVEVLDDGNLALSRGPYRLTSTADGGSSSEAWGTFNSIWRRSADGNWRVVFDAGSAPVETPTNEARALLGQDDHGCGRESVASRRRKAHESAERAATAAEADEAAIKNLIEEVEEANNAGDVERWVELFAGDAVYMAPGAPPISDRAGLTEVAKAGFRHRAAIDIEPVEIRVANDWAFSRTGVTGKVTLHDSGEVVPVDVKQIVIYARAEDGSWRIARMINNSNRE